MNVLFVCSRNRWRSPTAEHVFGRDPRWNVRSAGTSSSAARTVNAGDLRWADTIFVMERAHRARLRERFPESRSMDVVVLDIADDHEYLGGWCQTRRRQDDDASRHAASSDVAIPTRGVTNPASLRGGRLAALDIRQFNTSLPDPELVRLLEELVTPLLEERVDGEHG